MSSSGSSPARRALEEFVAGALPADRLVAAVAGRFYGAAGQGEREALRAVIEVVERAAPGIVSLERKDGSSVVEVRPIERVFPEASLAALRGAAEAALAASWSDPTPAAPEALSPKPQPPSPVASPPGFFSRVVAAVRRLFSASA